MQITNLEEQLEQFREELENKNEELQQLHMQLEIEKKERRAHLEDLEQEKRFLQVNAAGRHQLQLGCDVEAQMRIHYTLYMNTMSVQSA